MTKEQKRLLVFLGLTGSGKSFLARQWAEKKGFAYFNTDIVRKQLAGIEPTQQCRDGLDSGLYSSEFSKKTYDALLDCAHEALRKGASTVILDGSFLLQGQRQRILASFGSELQVLFIYCFCADSVTRQRLKARLAEAAAVSDGRHEVYLAQLKKFEYPKEISAERILELDTDAPLEYLINRLEHFVTSALSIDGKESSPKK